MDKDIISFCWFSERITFAYLDKIYLLFYRWWQVQHVTWNILFTKWSLILIMPQSKHMLGILSKTVNQRGWLVGFKLQLISFTKLIACVDLHFKTCIALDWIKTKIKHTKKAHTQPQTNTNQRHPGHSR